MYTIRKKSTYATWLEERCYLGSAEGGDPYVGELYLRNQLAEGAARRY